MRLSARLLLALIAAHAITTSAHAADGPIALDAAGMDAVTAGSNLLPPTTTASRVLRDVVESFSSIGASTGGIYQEEDATAPDYSNAAAWYLANKGSRGGSAPGPGPGSAGTVIPSLGTVDYTRVNGGSDLTTFSQDVPGSHLRDFVHHNVQNQW